MITNNWPKEVPILTKKDMHKESLYAGEKACLLGWVGKIFPFTTMRETSVIEREFSFLSFLRRETVIAKIQKFTNEQDIVAYNDSHSLDTNALVWNKAMKELGYTEITDV